MDLSPYNLKRYYRSHCHQSVIFDQHAYHHKKDALAEVFLDEDEQLYNKIMDTITFSCLGMLGKNESPSKLVEIPSIQGSVYSVSRNNHKIMDSKNLSYVNFVYDSITFQVYPILMRVLTNGMKNTLRQKASTSSSMQQSATKIRD